MKLRVFHSDKLYLKNESATDYDLWYFFYICLYYFYSIRMQDDHNLDFAMA